MSNVVSPSSPAEWRALIRVLLIAAPLAIVGLFVGVVVMRWMIGDDIRETYASMDVSSLHHVLPRHEASNRLLVRETLRPDRDWRVLTATEFDWLTDQLPDSLQLNDDPSGRWRTAGLKDPWGRPYHTEMRVDEGGVTQFRVRSLGPDGQADTPDDVTQ